MKKFFFLILMIGVFLVVGCKDNATAPPAGGGIGGPGGGNGGGGNNGGVTFTVSLAQDNQQQYFFEFKPSAAVVINTITGNCPAAGVNNQQVQSDGTTVFDANNPAYVGPVTGLASGQQWNFSISGKVGSSTGSAYSATTQLTIP